jgi:hypothetical protein
MSDSDIEDLLHSWETPPVTFNAHLQSVLDSSGATDPCANASTSDSAPPNLTLRHRCIHKRFLYFLILTLNVHGKSLAESLMNAAIPQCPNLTYMHLHADIRGQTTI